MNTNEWSRRKFIGNTARAGALLLLNPFGSWAFAGQDEKVRKLVAKTMGIDTHNHMDVPFSRVDFEGLKYDLAKELHASGLTAICMTFCVDRPDLKQEGEAYKRFLMSLDAHDEILKTNELSRALNFADLKKARRDNKPIVIQSVEGGHFIEGKIERLKVGYDRGLRVLGLMHDGQSAPPIGDIYTEKPEFDGLTPLGVDIIKECNRLGILVDLAHCSNKAIDRALEVSSKPMLISHTGLNTRLGNNERMANMMLPRLISKEQAKKFADAGGVIGVWTHLADSPLEHAANVRALVDVVGTAHVCIGTDTKMAPPANSKDRFGKKTNESWEGMGAGFFYAVVEALLKTGFTEEQIMQIGGGNFCRIFEEATTIK